MPIGANRDEPTGFDGPLQVERIVAGGLGLARAPDGRIVLIEGSLPGDAVVAEVVEDSGRMIRARVKDVVTPSEHRVIPECPELHKGCGGCDLAHASGAAQMALKIEIVADSLRHIARITDAMIRGGEPLSGTGYRTTLRCGVDQTNGKLGFRARGTNNIHAVERCLVAHPLADDIIANSRFPSATEVTVRVGSATGDRMVVVEGTFGDAQVPTDVAAVRSGSGDVGFIHEEISSRRFRISGDSFFQARPDGAAALGVAVERALGDFDPSVDSLIDLYGGVGLFTGLLRAERSELVEVSRSACKDARVNLSDLGTKVINCTVERWRPSPATYVVADPARSGLGRKGVQAVVKTAAGTAALVSCDPAAMARDVSLMIGAGYELDWVEVVDMFPQTHHVETVTRFVRAGVGDR